VRTRKVFFAATAATLQMLLMHNELRVAAMWQQWQQMPILTIN
jgi:hypothetical protein